MAYKGVIFDLDGTLLATLADLADSVNSVLKAQGFATHPVAAYRRLVGDGMAIMVKRALPPAARTEPIVAACLSLVQEEYSRRWDNKTVPYPGIPQLLDELVSMNIKMAVLSNKMHKFTLLVVEKFLGNWEFEAILGASDGLPRKPDPSGAIRVASSLGLPPKEVVYVGDTDTDMKTAVNAGMFPVGVLWGFRSAEELQSNGARLLIESPGDLVDIFKRN